MLTALKWRRADASRGWDAAVGVNVDAAVEDLAGAATTRSPLLELVAARRREVLLLSLVATVGP